MASRRRRLTPVTMGVALTLALATGVVASQARNFVTPMSGGEEVPANASMGRGTAIFHLSHDGTELSYKVIASNIHNVHMAHIHLAPKGVNGGIVVWLFPAPPPNAPGPLGSGRHNGVLVTGTITAANLTGSLVNQPLSALVDEIVAGNAYVNVHTNDGMGVTGTGPGDLQAGEIRGQLD